MNYVKLLCKRGSYMNKIEKAYEILERILKKQLTFSMAMNKEINKLNMDSLDKSIVKDVIKGTVNRYHFLSWEVEQNYLETLSDLAKQIMILAFASVRYVKKITKEDVIEEVEQLNESMNLELNHDLFVNAITLAAEKIKEIPYWYDKKFTKKYALTFSYPEWLVKMWCKHFGSKNAFKTMQSSRRNFPLSVSLNPLLSTKEEILKSPLFKENEKVENSFWYLGKERIIDVPEFINKYIFVFEDAYQDIVNMMNPEQGDNLLVISEDKGNIAIDVAMKSYDMGEVNFATTNLSNVNFCKEMKEKYKISNLIAFETDAKMLITHIAQVDKILLIPPSSNLGMVRKRPDILLNFNRDEFDSLIETQKEYLEEAAKCLKSKGTIVYSVMTLNRKEGFDIVSDFLSRHEEFKVVEEKQIFPFQTNTYGYYVAKLEKGMDEND